MKSKSHGASSPLGSRATHQIPARFTSTIADGIPDTRAIGSSSTAPELALAAAGDNGALRCSGMIAPSLPANGRDQNIALVDIGAHVSHFYVLRNDQFLFSRDQAFGGNQLTYDIQRAFNLSPEEAESPGAIASSRWGGTTSTGTSFASSSRRGSWPSPAAW